MRKTKLARPGASYQNQVLSKPEMFLGLTEHAAEAGALQLPFTAQSSYVIVLEGELTYTPSGSVAGRRYGAGEGFSVEGERSLTLRAPTRLWQVVGRAELVWALERFSAQLARKDVATAAHAARVALLAADMGRYLALGSPQLEQLALAAYLHDLGKLNLPTALLRTTAPLTLPEWHLVIRHPHEGRHLLDDTPLAFAGTVAAQHHERLNGSGYPGGLQGDALAFESQLVAVADTFDAITYGRPYQGPRGPQQALSEINRYSGVLFVKEAVGALNATIKPKLAS